MHWVSKSGLKPPVADPSRKVSTESSSTSKHPWKAGYITPGTGDSKAFDNVVQNLERLDPNVTEIRYVVHESDPPIIDPFSPIIDMGFSIRLLRGDHTSQDYFTNFQNSVISDLNLKLEKVLKK